MTSDGKLILLVEDEMILSLATRKILERNGYRVLTAANGEKAIALVEQTPDIGMILMDINLGPGIDGTEAAKIILSNHNIPLIFHSSHTEAEIVEKTEGITSYGYIVKNTGETVLLASMRMAYKLHNADKALGHSRDLLNYVIEHSRSAVAIHDRDYRYIYVSKQYLKDYGIVDENIIGKHHYAVFPDLPQKWRDVHALALQGVVSSAEDDVYERADGSREWTRWECRPWYAQDGTIGGFIVYTEVITGRKEAELAQQRSKEKYEAVVQAMDEGFWIVNQSGRLTEVNEAYARMSGYSKEELLQLSIDQLEAVQSVEDIIKTGQRVRTAGFDTFNTRHRRKDGSTFAVQVSIRRLGDDYTCFCMEI